MVLLEDFERRSNDESSRMSRGIREWECGSENRGAPKIGFLFFNAWTTNSGIRAFASKALEDSWGNGRCVDGTCTKIMWFFFFLLYMYFILCKV